MSDAEIDLAIVKRVQSGDKRAFNLLVAKYQHKILNLVGRFIANPSDRDDIAQEAFLKAYRAIGNFRGDSAFYTWLYRIAVNTAKNHNVSQSRRPPSQDIPADDAVISGHDLLSDRLTPESHLASKELAALLKQTIADLPELLKEALVLREFEGMSYDEIAMAMDCPIGTVRSRIFRARDMIEKAIRDYS